MPPERADADAVADLTRAVAGVAGLHPGAFGEVATYLPGRRVAGVRVDDERIDVHVSVTLAAPVREVAAQVREVVAAAYPGRIVDVTVEDVAVGPLRNPSPSVGQPSVGQPADGHAHIGGRAAISEGDNQ